MVIEDINNYCIDLLNCNLINNRKKIKKEKIIKHLLNKDNIYNKGYHSSIKYSK